MSNLTNVYAHLRSKYVNLDIQFGMPMSFIKTLCGITKQKIIFIYKEVSFEII